MGQLGVLLGQVEEMRENSRKNVKTWDVEKSWMQKLQEIPERSEEILILTTTNYSPSFDSQSVQLTPNDLMTSLKSIIVKLSVLLKPNPLVDTKNI